MGIWTPDLHDVDAVLHDLIYQGNSELVVMWVDDKPVDDGWGCTHISGLLSRHSALSSAKKLRRTYTFISIGSSNTWNSCIS